MPKKREVFKKVPLKLLHWWDNVPKRYHPTRITRPIHGPLFVEECKCDKIPKKHYRIWQGWNRYKTLTEGGPKDAKVKIMIYYGYTKFELLMIGSMVDGESDPLTPIDECCNIEAASKEVTYKSMKELAELISKERKKKVLESWVQQRIKGAELCRYVSKKKLSQLTISQIRELSRLLDVDIPDKESRLKAVLKELIGQITLEATIKELKRMVNQELAKLGFPPPPEPKPKSSPIKLTEYIPFPPRVKKIISGTKKRRNMDMQAFVTWATMKLLIEHTKYLKKHEKELREWYEEHYKDAKW